MDNVEEKDTMNNTAETPVNDSTTEKAKDFVKEALDTEDTSSEYSKEDIEKNKVMAILSYILPFIPYFVEKDSKWVKYHSTQGMNLLVISIAFAIINTILRSVITVNRTVTVWGLTSSVRVTPGWLSLPLNLISLAIGVLAVIGIINVINGKAKELPFVNKVKVFK